MQCINPLTATGKRSSAAGWPLFSTADTRRIERELAAALPPYTLMQRAGLAVARLAAALAPHARIIWIACGPGNNGGDGLEAAARLTRLLPFARIAVSCTAGRDEMPADAQASWDRAQDAKVQWLDDRPEDMDEQDLCIDALLGIGLRTSKSGKNAAPAAKLLQLLRQTQAGSSPVLCIDIASGLDAETGRYAAGMAPSPPTDAARMPRHTLGLLTLQPGLFTGQGRDACGQVWWDELGAGLDSSHAEQELRPMAWLSHPPNPQTRPHDSHKGSFGDVAVVGGEGLAQLGLSMTGAAWLAALAALHGGAGRVMLALLDTQTPPGIAPWPEIMLRQPDAQDWSRATVVCGCGGGDAIKPWLPVILQQAPRLVLDADALNAVATDSELQLLLTSRTRNGQGTVLTPHPLEAARLLHTTAGQVQSNRLQAAMQLAEQLQCTVVLKGSGSVIARPTSTDNSAPACWINPTGNARLATGGTGDVLAGLLGAVWARMATQNGEPLEIVTRAAIDAVYRHGQAADLWPSSLPFSASALARRLGILSAS
ncbi:bifunctional NAD(P)H-hydrate repair enzyme [Comamonas phosphati]|nr:bifunctional NAD(P)H-hydrate repair enzyme [Comamonas phosphati]